MMQQSFPSILYRHNYFTKPKRNWNENEKFWLSVRKSDFSNKIFPIHFFKHKRTPTITFCIFQKSENLKSKFVQITNEFFCPKGLESKSKIAFKWLLMFSIQKFELRFLKKIMPVIALISLFVRSWLVSRKWISSTYASAIVAYFHKGAKNSDESPYLPIIN